MARKISGMTRKVSDPTRSWRRGLLLSLVLLAGAGLAVQAVHDDGFFELDRNVVSQENAGCPTSNTCGDDWDVIFTEEDTDDSADASTFVTDVTNGTIFTTGASKDDLDTTGWLHTSGSVPDKDELQHAYAARYGDNIYFGADRIANNGDAQMGFWFFQGDVQACTVDNTDDCGPVGTFGPDAHTEGDILVLSDFSKGGGLVTIRVFRWVPGGPINGTLELIGGTTDPDNPLPADCMGPLGSNDNFCGTVNTDDVNSPWPFDPKTGANDVMRKGMFYEGGIDLAFLGLDDECFSSFLAETRASTSVDATLKDFVGGAFQPCTSGLKTTPSDANGVALEEIVLGQSIYDHALVSGEGSDETPTGTVSFYICAPDELTGGACVDDPDNATDGGTFVSTGTLAALDPPEAGKAETISEAFEPTTTGTWCWRGEYSGGGSYPAATDSSTGECFEVTQLQPTISTAQTFTVQDTATISVTGSLTLKGSVRFRLFETLDCTGTAVVDQIHQVVNAASGVEVTTTQVEITTTKEVLSWLVEYTSTEDAHLGVTSTCRTESASLTINNTPVD